MIRAIVMGLTVVALIVVLFLTLGFIVMEGLFSEGSLTGMACVTLGGILIGLLDKGLPTN